MDPAAVQTGDVQLKVIIDKIIKGATDPRSSNGVSSAVVLPQDRCWDDTEQFHLYL